MKETQKGFATLEGPLVLLVVFFIILSGWFVFKHLAANNNTTYFSRLYQTTKSYYFEQAAALGIQPSANDLVKTCYQQDQDADNNGHLACGIEVDINVPVKPNGSYITSLIARLNTVAKRQGFYVYGYYTKTAINGAGYDAATRDGFNPKLCSLNVGYSPDTAYPDAKTTMSYVLNCSNNASSVPAGFTYQN